MESATITATYHDGTLTLQEPIDLPDGSHVEVQIKVLPTEEILVDAWTAQIRRESEAFIQQHKQLRTQYQGHYIAMHDGEVIDHDADKRALSLRIRAQWENTPILIRLVTTTPVREVIVRSPRLER